jgi:hypothetical protein
MINNQTPQHAFKANKWNPVPEIERFWMKVKVLGPDECWPWQAGKDKRGYGQFRTANKMSWAHRYALQVKLGREVTPGMETLHSCDNPSCCNPAHLSEGITKQNIQDMFRRGRGRPGGRPAQGLKHLRQIKEQNKRNGKPRRDNTSGYTGVQVAKSGKFEARIKRFGKSIGLGTYETAEAAHEAYLAAKKKLGNSASTGATQ